MERGKHRQRTGTLAKRIKISPWTLSMGLGRTGMASRSLRDRICHGKSSRAPPYKPAGAHLLFLLGRNGRDGSASASLTHCSWPQTPISWHIAYKTQHKLGSYCFLLGRNGHNGAGIAPPDPLLLAPDPISGLTAHRHDTSWAVTPQHTESRQQPQTLRMFSATTHSTHSANYRPTLHHRSTRC